MEESVIITTTCNKVDTLAIVIVPANGGLS